MRRSVLLVLGGLVGSLVATTVASVPAPALADSPGGTLVSEVAASGTPHVLDGRVFAVAQVGDTMLLGGTFSQARDNAGDTAVKTRNRLLAFDRETGKLRPGFLPEPNGTIRTIVPSGDGSTVYVVGAFTRIGGVARQRVARIRVSDGAVVPSFDAGAVNGEVKDAVLRGGRLWIGGAFTHVGGRAQRALATLDPATGARTAYMSLAVSGTHRGDGVTQVIKLDASPDGRRLVAVGNFSALAGATAQQLFSLDLTGPAAAPGALRTGFYATQCSAAYDTYLRDVDFSPSGRWFVVSTTGAYGGSTGPCDTVARFESDATGADVEPSWVDYTGGDTTYAVEATEAVVYVGGHGRWWNNPYAGNRAGQGAVAREGIAALDPLNGLPLSWNPGRTKGVGLFDFLVTPTGLWVASDTDRIGDYQYRARIALLPSGGLAVPAVRTTVLPNDLYSVGTGGTATRRYLTPGELPSAARGLPAGPVDWRTVTGAFMVNGVLYAGHADGTFDRQAFNGTEWGRSVPVATADALVPIEQWRADLRLATSMFFDEGRIYFTRSDDDRLFYRYFTPQSGVVGAQRFVAAGSNADLDLARVRGMVVTPEHVYWATATGELRRQEWQRDARHGRPVAGTTEVVSGPAVDSATWGGRALFLHQSYAGGPVADQPPATTTSYVASARGSANAATHRLTVPTAVRSGDTLVLTLGVNRSDVAVSAPAGWTALDSVTTSGATGHTWTRTATAADAGSAVTATTSDLAKGELTLHAYRATGGSAVLGHAAAVDAASGTEHTAPSVTVPAGGGWVLTQWVAKTSADLTWTRPSGTTTRLLGAGTGSGRMTGLGVDTGGAVAAGTHRTAPATTSAAARSLVFTVVVGTR